MLPNHSYNNRSNENSLGDIVIYQVPPPSITGQQTTRRFRESTSKFSKHLGDSYQIVRRLGPKQEALTSSSEIAKTTSTYQMFSVPGTNDVTKQGSFTNSQPHNRTILLSSDRKSSLLSLQLLQSYLCTTRLCIPLRFFVLTQAHLIVFNSLR